MLKKISLKNVMLLTHSHKNMENILEKFSENEDGKLIFDGKVFSASELTNELLTNIFKNYEYKNVIENTDNLIFLNNEEQKIKKTQEQITQEITILSNAEYDKNVKGTLIICAGGITTASIIKKNTQIKNLANDCNFYNFGNLVTGRNRAAALSNKIKILIIGGSTVEKLFDLKSIETISFSTLADSQNFNNLCNIAKGNCASIGNEINGFTIGGSTKTTSVTNIADIEKITFSTNSNMNKISDLSEAITNLGGCGNKIFGVTIGGYTSTATKNTKKLDYSNEAISENFYTLGSLNGLSGASASSNDIEALIIGGGLGIPTSSQKLIFSTQAMTSYTVSHTSTFASNGANKVKCCFFANRNENGTVGSVNSNAANYYFYSGVQFFESGQLETLSDATGNSNGHGGCL